MQHCRNRGEHGTVLPPPPAAFGKDGVAAIAVEFMAISAEYFLVGERRLPRQNFAKPLQLLVVEGTRSQPPILSVDDVAFFYLLVFLLYLL